MCKVLGFSVLAGDSNQSVSQLQQIAGTGWQQQQPKHIRKYKAEVVQMIQRTSTSSAT
jgi:hypothetical protein